MPISLTLILEQLGSAVRPRCRPRGKAGLGSDLTHVVNVFIGGALEKQHLAHVIRPFSMAPGDGMPVVTKRALQFVAGSQPMMLVHVHPAITAPCVSSALSTTFLTLG